MSPTGARLLVDALCAHGVTAVFGLPGVQVMDLLDALYGVRDRIATFTVRHEQSALYMADGYARAGGREGVAVVVPGPGLLNALAGLGTAYACSSPVLLIAGQTPNRDLERGRGALHEVQDTLNLVRPLTKWRGRAVEAGDIAPLLAQAFYALRTGRPRPALLEATPDALAGHAEEGMPPLPVDSPPPPAEAVRSAADLLAGARRPLIWAGGGAQGAGDLVAQLAHLLGAPVITTPEGKGVVPEGRDPSAGVQYYDWGPAPLLQPQADAVLAVGTRLGYAMHDPAWALRPPQALVQVDADPAVVGQRYPARVGLVARARPALTALLDALAERVPQPRPLWTDLGRVRARVREQVEAVAPLQCALLDRLRRVLPPEAVVVSGITNVAYWAHLVFPVQRERSYLTSSYFATLGYAFPTALGARVACPDRPVVCLVGDGGFLYTATELATAVHHRIGVVVLLFNDEGYGATRNEQRLRYGGRTLATDLTNPDFHAFVESFGAYYLEAEPEGVDRAVVEALRLAREEALPVVVEVPIPTLTPPFQARPPSL